MSGETIDLADVHLQLINLPPSADRDALLAMVAGIRSALALVADLRRVGPESWVMAYVQKHHAALAPFTDSAEQTNSTKDE